MSSGGGRASTLNEATASFTADMKLTASSLRSPLSIARSRPFEVGQEFVRCLRGLFRMLCRADPDPCLHNVERVLVRRVQDLDVAGLVHQDQVHQRRLVHVDLRTDQRRRVV